MNSFTSSLLLFFSSLLLYFYFEKNLQPFVRIDLVFQKVYFLLLKMGDAFWHIPDWEDGQNKSSSLVLKEL